MNGVHDLGGMMGFGKVVPEVNEPVFHAPWEARLFALVIAVGQHGGWTLDEDRSACENRPPTEYLRLSYYEIWYAAVTALLAEKAMLSTSALPDPRNVLKPDQVWAAVHERSTYLRVPPTPQKFNAGDHVRARNMHPETHTRLPRYLRGHIGEIVTVHGAHVFPDANARGRGEDPQWLYTVRFTATELWGRANVDTVMLDFWEPYLEPA